MSETLKRSFFSNLNFGVNRKVSRPPTQPTEKPPQIGIERGIFVDDSPRQNLSFKVKQESLIKELTQLPQAERLSRLIFIFNTTIDTPPSQLNPYLKSSHINAICSDEVMGLLATSPLEGAKIFLREVSRKKIDRLIDIVEDKYISQSFSHLYLNAYKSQVAAANGSAPPEIFVSHRTVSAFGYLCNQLMLHPEFGVGFRDSIVLSVAIQGIMYGMFDPTEHLGARNITNFSALSAVIPPGYNRGTSFGKIPVIKYIIDQQVSGPEVQEIDRQQQLQALIDLWRYTTPHLVTLGRLEGQHVPINPDSKLTAERASGPNIRQLMTPGINPRTGKSQDLSEIQRALLTSSFQTSENQYKNSLVLLLKKYAQQPENITYQTLGQLVNKEAAGLALKQLAEDPENNQDTLQTCFTAINGGKKGLQELLHPDFFAEDDKVQMLFLYYLFQTKAVPTQKLNSQLLYVVENNLLLKATEILAQNQQIKKPLKSVSTTSQLLSEYSEADYQKAQTHAREFLQNPLPELHILSEENEQGQEKLQQLIDTVLQSLGSSADVQYILELLNNKHQFDKHIYNSIYLTFLVGMILNIFAHSLNIPQLNIVFINTMALVMGVSNILLVNATQFELNKAASQILARSTLRDNQLKYELNWHAKQSKANKRKQNIGNISVLAASLLLTNVPQVKDNISTENAKNLMNLGLHAIGLLTETATIGNTAEGIKPGKPTFVAYGVAENIIWIQNICELSPNNTDTSCIQNWQEVSTPVTVVKDLDQLQKLTTEYVKKGYVVRLNLKQSEQQTFDTPAGYIQTGILTTKPVETVMTNGINLTVSTDNGYMAAVYKKIESDVITGSIKETASPDLLSAADLKKNPTVDRIITQALILKNNKASSRELLDFLQQTLKDIGITYGYADYQSIAQNPAQEMAHLFEMNTDGTLKNNEWICNMFSYAIYVMGTELGLDVKIVTGTVQNTDTIYGGYDHLYHQIVSYREPGETHYKTFEATLPSGGEAVETPNKTEDYFEQEKKNAQNRALLILGLEAILGVIGVSATSIEIAYQTQKRRKRTSFERNETFSEMLYTLNDTQLKAVYYLLMSITGKIKVSPAIIDEPNLGVIWQDFSKEGGQFEPTSSHISRISEEFLSALAGNEKLAHSSLQSYNIDNFIRQLSSVHLDKIRVGSRKKFVVAAFRNFFGKKETSELNHQQIMQNLRLILNEIKNKQNQPENEQGALILQTILQSLNA